MNVLLSIRPQYVDKIIAGAKRYEFRKSVFKKPVDEVWMYATSPVKKIVGTFVMREIIQDTPENLWKNLNGLSGLSEEEFFRFWAGRRVGVALAIDSLKLFKVPLDPKTVFPDFTPPRSFYYFESSLVEATEIPITYGGEGNGGKGGA